VTYAGVLLIVTGLQAAAIVALLVARVQRTRAKQVLHASEARFRLMLVRAPGMVWTAGPDTTLAG